MLETPKLPLLKLPQCDACVAFDVARRNAVPGHPSEVRAPEIHGSLARVDEGSDESMAERWRCTRCGAVWEVSLLAAREEESVVVDEIAGERRTAHRHFGGLGALIDLRGLEVAWSVSPQRFELTAECAPERIATGTRVLVESRSDLRREGSYPLRVNARVVVVEGECPAKTQRGPLSLEPLVRPPEERATPAWSDSAVARFGTRRAARVLAAWHLEGSGRAVDVWLSDLRVDLGALAFTAPHLLDECDLHVDHLALVFELIEGARSPDELRATLDELRATGRVREDVAPQIHMLRADRAAVAAQYDPFELDAWTALARGMPGLLVM